MQAASLFQCLQQALKSDQATRQRAEAELAACENQPGYCSCLLVSLSSQQARCKRSWDVLMVQGWSCCRQSSRAGRTTAPAGWL